eukprot:TRINITY_DN3687_c0_g1_i2.p1 TRINITY_DN3687_c0_g1~~TRINITY_DN3687_c0_g1_i2.p1  ORF type:complete len:545 (-),score=142.91 TRINITY_DN3687_c0_g1_i2:262-1896(-)
MDHVSSIQGLASIRKRIYEKLSGLNDEAQWEASSKEILGSPLNLWNEFFEAVFVERAEALIESKVGGSIYVIESSLDTLLSSSHLHEQSDLSSYMWTETPGVKLSMQTLCFSPEIQSLCSSFDSTFKSLLEDLSSYVEEGTPSELLESLKKSLGKKTSEPFSLTANNESLLGFMKASIDKQLRELFTRIDSKYGKNSSSLEAMFILIGRLYQAIPELSIHWANALTLVPPSEKLLLSRSKGDTVLEDLKSELGKQSRLFFDYWKSSCLKSLDQRISFGEGDQKTYLEILPKWESLTITEESEEGKSVESIIRVPNAPSAVLVNALNDLCRTIYNVGAQSLPSGILNSFSHDACLELLRIYDEKSVKKLQKIPQEVALQLLFDLKFIHQIMISGEAFDLTESHDELLKSLESHIDPFDLDVFSDHISKRVQRSALAYQCLFGALIPSSRYSILNSLKGLQSNASGSKQDAGQFHNLLNMATNSKTRFPRLPIPSSGRDVSSMSRTSLNRLVPDVNKRKVSNKTIESSPSAGGFLSAVSSSFFGSK